MQKIIVVESERLLGAAIISLLYSEDDLDVLGLTPITTSDLIDTIVHLQPDVVIIDQASRFIDAIRLLLAHHCSTLRLIVVNANDNWVSIVHRQRVLITKRGDLASIIHNGQCHHGLKNPTRSIGTKPPHTPTDK